MCVGREEVVEDVERWLAARARLFSRPGSPSELPPHWCGLRRTSITPPEARLMEPTCDTQHWAVLVLLDQVTPPGR